MTQGSDIGPGKWPDISRVFAAAAAPEGASREAYLDSACQHDPGLRAAVDSMLDAHNDAGSFGSTPQFALSTARKRLSPGSQLGPFRIESLLGSGGMGEVYRAYDTKLHRAVAIKVLPDFFAQDAHRIARFEEEARALAALNHPHVGALYGLEESAGIAALVLELVDGPTLAERLVTGPLPVDEIVRIARQLAEGLEAADKRGIIHRDTGATRPAQELRYGATSWPHRGLCMHRSQRWMRRRKVDRPRFAAGGLDHGRTGRPCGRRRCGRPRRERASIGLRVGFSRSQPERGLCQGDCHVGWRWHIHPPPQSPE